MRGGSSCAAQALTGALIGTVKDEQGGILPGALVRVTSPALIGGLRKPAAKRLARATLGAMPVRTDSFVPRGEAIRQAFADASGADLVYFMRQCLERGAHDHARALGDALPERFADEPTLALTLAIARFLGGR